MRTSTFIATLSLVFATGSRAKALSMDSPYLTFTHTFDHGQAIRLKSSQLLSSVYPVANPTIVFSEAIPSLVADALGSQTEATIRTKPMRVRRPRSQAQFHAARQRMRRGSTAHEAVEWDEIEVVGPDYEDRMTILELAKMTGNAYSSGSQQKNWYPLDDQWNTVSRSV